MRKKSKEIDEKVEEEEIEEEGNEDLELERKLRFERLKMLFWTLKVLDLKNSKRNLNLEILNKINAH